MTKQTLKQLVRISIKDHELDEKTVMKIAERLNRHELKRYIHHLKAELTKNTVTITTPRPLSNTAKQLFKETYKSKRLEFINKPDILLGVQIVDNDMVYDASLKHTLDDVARFVAE